MTKTKSIIIVDENNHEIAVKSPAEFDYTRDIYRVSVLWVMNGGGQVLMQQRNLQMRNEPGLWGPSTAGTVEGGETYLQNVIKEAAEEIGLTNVEFKPIFQYHHHERRNYFAQDYLAVVDQPIEFFSQETGEVNALKWVDLDWLKDDVVANPDNYVPSMCQTVEKLVEYLENQTKEAK